MNSGIYQIRCLVNGRIYVGSAVNLKRRWSFHQKRLRRGLHASSLLQASWSKHGENQFVFEVLEHVADHADLLEREQYWIDTLKPFEKSRGYNIRLQATSNLGITLPKGTGAKIAAANTGRKHTAESRANMSAGMMGRKLNPEHKAKLHAISTNPSPETRAKMSASRKAYKQSPETIAKSAAARKGLKLSEETRAKMSAWRTGRKTGSAAAFKAWETKRRKQQERQKAKQLTLFD